MKLLLVLFFVLGSINTAQSDNEVLEERFKKYEWNPVVYGKNQQENIFANGETVTIYSPLLDYATLKIKPRPREIQEALNNPGKFFKKDAEKAVSNFRKFAKDYKNCVEKKKWPENVECTSKFDICFDENETRAVCNWVYHEVIGNCIDSSANQGKGLRNCFQRSERMFDLFNKCFDETALIDLTFEIYGEMANRRTYYTLDSDFYNDKLKGTKCRFTVSNETNYRLISISSAELGRPELSVVPIDLYVKDHYEDLLEIQRNAKVQEAKKSKLKSKKNSKTRMENQ